MRMHFLISGLMGFWAVSCHSQNLEAACQSVTADSSDYVVCRFDPSEVDINLHLKNSDGEIFGNFDPLKADLEIKGATLGFAMNGGMYHMNRDAVGLYVEDGQEFTAISTKPGSGNFHMLPNGVFSVERAEAEGRQTITAHVRETKRYLEESENVNLATQSGPMLVISGKLHPRFIKDSTSRKIRNGVGLTNEGDVVFAISDTPVNFYMFASLFRDTLKTDNALYLDGTISRIYSKDLRRNDKGMPMGPIISVTVPAPEKDRL